MPLGQEAARGRGLLSSNPGRLCGTGAGGQGATHSRQGAGRGRSWIQAHPPHLDSSSLTQTHDNTCSSRGCSRPSFQPPTHTPCVHTLTCTHLHEHTLTRTHTYMQTHAHIYVCTRSHTYMCTLYTHAHTYRHTLTCMHTPPHAQEQPSCSGLTAPLCGLEKDSCLLWAPAAFLRKGPEI